MPRKIAVSPEIKDPPYDIVLDDGTDQIGLVCVDQKGQHNPDVIGRNPVQQSSLKTSTGNQKYSDLMPPYTVIAQDNWTGGRGAAEFEKDTTRFAESYRCNTERATGVIMGGRETYSTGLRASNLFFPGSLKLIPLTEGRRYLAKRFTVSTNYNAELLWVWVRRRGTPKDVFTVRLRADNSNLPDTVLQTTTLAVVDAENLISSLQVLAITAEALSNGVSYWIEVIGAENDTDENHWEVGCLNAAGNSQASADGTGGSYSYAAIDLYYRTCAADAQSDGFLIEYKKAKYLITRPGDGTASKIYINGERGLAASNAGQLNKLICSVSNNLAVNEAVGKVIMVIEGTGSSEEQNWRMITANDINSFAVDTPWLITHDATTVWVVLGLDRWQEITGHGLTYPVTDVLISSQSILYLCQGENATIRRMKEEVSGGAWTRTFAGEAANKAVFLAEYNDSNQMKLVRTNGDMTASEGNTPTTWSDVSFGTAKAVGDKWDRITGVVPYFNDSGDYAVWILKEGLPWQWKTAVVNQVNVEELRTIASYKNGRVTARANVYLYVSIQNTLFKYYRPNFDDIGPTLDNGLPEERQGPVSAIIAYPGRIFIAVDAGADGYSSVLSNTGGTAWHEIYRAPKGQRIFAMDHQVVPGALPDRLWIRQGADMLWIPLPSETYDPFQDSNYPYTHESMLEIASVNAGLMDAYKYWAKLKVRTQNLIDSTTWIEADYRQDEDTEWIPLPEAFIESPVSEQDFDEEFGISGKILHVRYRMYTTDQYQTPKLTSSAIFGVTVTEPKFSYNVLVQAGYQDLHGKPETMKPYEKIRKLDDWCGRARPLKMYCVNPLYDNVKVFLQPLPTRPLASAQKVKENTYQCTIIVQEA